MEQEKPGKEEVRRRLREILAQQGKLKERDLLRVSAITGVDYFTVAQLSRELEEGPAPGTGKER
ncbi:MAG: hypothetical protein HYY89_01015 [candidate division NC10 bacterium]|nr:hypothetical protein [candidate division NC10 bacterium]MBI4413479.1 hypothetical protein [candidate division NC10 bacterium]